MSANKGLFKKYFNNIFIETGTYHGDGVQQALEAGFLTVVSFELSEKLHNDCVERFKDNLNVLLIQGDSAVELPKFIKHIKSSITFWLDGHYCGGETAIGKQNTPLLQELEAIKDHPVKTHTLLIDDLRGWYKDTQGFDTLDLMKKILEINPDYLFILENGFDPELNIIYPYDILVARCL